MNLKIIFSIVILVCSVKLNSQFTRTSIYVQQLLDREDSVSLISSYYPSNIEFNPISGDYENLESALYSSFATSSKNKSFSLSKSHLLKLLSDSSVVTWNNSYFKDNRYKSKILTKLLRVVHHSNSKFGLIDCFLFEIPLIKNEDNFYYDKSEFGSGSLGLYQGQKKKRIDNEDPIPVELFTEKELVELITKKCKSKGVYKLLKNGNFYVCGITIAPAEKTFFSSKTPTAKVLILFGSKRLHLVKNR